MSWSWSNWSNWGNWSNFSEGFNGTTETITDGESFDPIVSGQMNYGEGRWVTSFVFSVQTPNSGDELYLDLTGTTLTAVGDQIYNGAILIATVTGGVDGVPLTITPATLASGQSAQSQALSNLVSAVRYVNDDSSETYSRTILLTTTANNGQIYSTSSTVTAVAGASPPDVELAGVTNGIGTGTIATTISTGNSSSNPSIAALDGSGYVAVWQFYDSAGNWNIAVQQMDSAGQPVGAVTTLDYEPGTFSSDQQPSVTALENGGFVVTWAVIGSPGMVVAQLFDSSGSAVGSPVAVNTTTSNHYDPQVVSLADGGFLVTWHGYSTEGYFDVFAQRFDSDGTPVGSEITLTSDVDHDRSPSAAVLTDGTMVIAYDNGAGNIVFQRFASDGALLASETVAMAASNSTPIVIALENGNFVIAGDYYPGDGDNYGIIAQVFDPNGDPVGEPLVVNQIVSGNQFYVSGTALSDGGFVLTWSSAAGDGFYDIVAQRFSADGNPIGEEFVVYSQASVHGYGSRGTGGVIELADGSLAFTWQSNSTVQTRVFEVEPILASLDGMQNTDLPIPLTLDWPDQDGSETMVVELSGFPAGATFNLGEAGPAGTWLISISDPDQIGTLVMTPPRGWSGDFNLIVTATTTETTTTDTASDTLTVPVHIEYNNSDPVLTGAQPNLADGFEDQTYTVTEAQLLQGYTDADGDTLLVANLSADHGTVTDNKDGTYTITPPPNYNGPIVLSYNVVDDNGGSAGATLEFSLGAINDVPVGSVTISGTAAEDQTLTASNTLADEDGLGTVTYQWLRNGVAIDGATGSTYVLTQADVGANISVTASYIDGQGTAESRTSAETGAVANVNDNPQIAGTLTSAASEDDPVYTVNLLSGATDEDGDTLNVSGVTLVSGNASGITLSGNNLQVDPAAYGHLNAGQSEVITYSYLIDDGNGGTVAQTVTITILGANDAPLPVVWDMQTGTFRADTLYGDRSQAGTSDLINGGAGNDKIYGKDGNDQLLGGLGNDLLSGGSGNDILIGGKGSDTLTGGDGADTFVFHPLASGERDVITDFTIGEDILSLQGGVTILSQYQAAGSTVLKLSSGATVTLKGVSLDDWSASMGTSVQLLGTIETYG